MLGLLTKRWREENSVTLKELAALLSALGWKISPGRLSQIETAAGQGETREWRETQIDAVERATKYPSILCRFFAGRHPFNLAMFDPDEVLIQDLEAGFAMLAMCLGKPGSGPQLTPEMHERVKRQFATDEPLSAAELASTQERVFSTEVPFDIFQRN